MNLLLSEDHAWESTLCNEATAAVGVCQYEWQSGINIYIYTTLLIFDTHNYKDFHRDQCTEATPLAIDSFRCFFL